MTTTGIEAVFLEAHNWGKSAGFFQALGFTLDFETDHNSGLLRNGDGRTCSSRRVPAARVPQMQVVLNLASEAGLPDVDVTAPLADTHYGTREMTVRDPEGRLWTLQAPEK